MTLADAPVRKIVHVDMDAFYASVEQRDNPDLRGKPVAVGGARQRGVVAAASYEARVYGVRSAMASVTALRRCPDLIFVRPRFEVYRAVSQQIREIFAQFTPVIEPLSLDEAYLDLTDHLGTDQTATKAARQIRTLIFEATGLTASAGISYNKFLAKIASDQNKPNGQYVITPRQGPDFVAGLPVRKFHGIGPATGAKMAALGIETGADLRDRDLGFLERHFGKSGWHYYNVARGIDHRQVRADRIRKSIGTETTYAEDLFDLEHGQQALVPLAQKAWDHAQKHHIRAKTVTVKVKFADFRQVTRARSLSRFITDDQELMAMAQDLLAGVMPDPRGVRLLGVTLSGLDRIEATPDMPAQLDLFEGPD